MPALTTSRPAGFPPPTAAYAGSNSARQSIGLPGHCEPCAQRGHVRAHPDLGCGDVGCNLAHDDRLQAAADRAARAPIRVVPATPTVPDRPARPYGFPPPTAAYAGSNSARQSIGLPGHCERCAQLGHVRAHRDLGCGDVGCNRAHG